MIFAFLKAGWFKTREHRENRVKPH